MLFRKQESRNWYAGGSWVDPSPGTHHTMGDTTTLKHMMPYYVTPRPQAYKDTSTDTRKNFSSFFAFGKRSGEKDAFRQAHMTPSGTPGVVTLGVLDPTTATPIPYAPFEWDGRQMVTDGRGMIKYVEKDYFQTAISLENERVKYVSKMIALVVGQPAESVINLFGMDFYDALQGDTDPQGPNAERATKLYQYYLNMAGVENNIAQRKASVFRRYASAECSPEVMCNFGDNDPEWSRAFNKLSLLIEYHPSAILFDSGTINPLESSGKVHGDSGHSNAGPMTESDKMLTETIEGYTSGRPTSAAIHGVFKRAPPAPAQAAQPPNPYATSIQQQYAFTSQPT